MSTFLVAAVAVSAQDTIRYDTIYFARDTFFYIYQDTHYMHYPLYYHSLAGTQWYASYTPDGVHVNYEEDRSLYYGYHADQQTLIYGIAATGVKTPKDYAKEVNSTLSVECDIYALLLDSGFNHIDSVKWQDWQDDPLPDKYFVYPQMHEGTVLPDTVVPTYEFYFDTPVAVSGPFFIGLRIHNFPDTLSHGPLLFSVGSCHDILMKDMLRQVYNFRTHTYSNVILRNPLWGGYFPILTPRRCDSDPVRDVRMTSATDTSIILEWYGGLASQWEVAYSEDKEGAITYTMTTTVPRATLTGLYPSTLYRAHVRGMCEWDSVYGEWTPFIRVRTTAHQPDDTTQGPDTVSVDVVGLLTRLAPNPATGLVTVQSSYSLNHVAVYDVQGHLVLEQKAAETAATFDVGRLPKGVYVVSIRTAAGTTTKRLLVE